jgi:hypothetical protein
MGNDASRLQGGFDDPIAELKTLTTIASGLPQFSLSEWKASVLDMKINERFRLAAVFFRTVLSFDLDEYYQNWDNINNSTYEMTACKVFAFLLRHVSLEMKIIVFRDGFNRQTRNNIKFQFFRYVHLMIEKEDDVQGIQQLKELLNALDWRAWIKKLRNKIWKSATSMEMLEVLELNEAYAFPSSRLDMDYIDFWVPEPSISSKDRRIGMKNMVKKDLGTNAFRPLAMLQYFYAEKFEKTYSTTWRNLVRENDNPTQRQVDEFITHLKDLWFYLMIRACIREGNIMGLQFLLSKSPPWKTIGKVVKHLPRFIKFNGEAALKNPQMLTEILIFIDRPEWTDILDVWPFEGKVDLVYSTLEKFLKILSDYGEKEFYDDLITILEIQLIVWNKPLVHEKFLPNLVDAAENPSGELYAIDETDIPLLNRQVQRCYNSLVRKMEEQTTEEGIRLVHFNWLTGIFRFIHSGNVHACNIAWAFYYLYHHVHGKTLVNAEHWNFSYAWVEWLRRNDPTELFLARQAPPERQSAKRQSRKRPRDNESSTSNKQQKIRADGVD